MKRFLSALAAPLNRLRRRDSYVFDPFAGAGGLLQDAVAFVSLAAFIFAAVMLAGVAGELVAAARIGAPL